MFCYSRFRWRVALCRAYGTGIIAFSTSGNGNHRHKRKQNRCQRAPQENQLEVAIQTEEVLGADKMGHFFVTGATDAAGELGHFDSCRKDVCVFMHCSQDNFAAIPGFETFTRDHRLRLETPGWRNLDNGGNRMIDEKVEGQTDRILISPMLVRDGEYSFSQDIVVNSTGGVKVSLQILGKMSSLLKSLRLSGSFDLVHQLWAHFSLISVQVNKDVTWLREAGLVCVPLVRKPLHECSN